MSRLQRPAPKPPVGAPKRRIVCEIAANTAATRSIETETAADRADYREMRDELRAHASERAPTFTLYRFQQFVWRPRRRFQWCEDRANRAPNRTEEHRAFLAMNWRHRRVLTTIRQSRNRGKVRAHRFSR